MEYNFTYKGKNIKCVQTFGKEFDVIIDNKLVLTDYMLIPNRQDTFFEGKIIELLKGKI